MAKKKKNRNQSNGNGWNNNHSNTSQSGSFKTVQSDVFSRIEDSVLKVTECLNEDAPVMIVVPQPPQAVVDAAAVETLNGYLNELNRFVREIEDVTRKRDAARRKYEGLQEEVSAERSSLSKERDDLTGLQADMAEKEKLLAEKERNLEEREQNARDNFIKQNEEVLAERGEHVAKLEQRRLELSLELEEMRRVAFANLNDEQSKRREELRKLEEILEAKSSENESKERKLERDRIRFDAQWRELADEKERIRSEVELEAQNELEKLQLKLVTAQNQRDKTYLEITERERELAEYEDLKRALAGNNIDDFLLQFNQMRQENRELKRQVEVAGETDYVAENERLRLERDSLRERVRDLETNSVHALAELHVSRVSVLDKERLESEKRALLQHKQLLTAHLNDLETRVEALTKAQLSSRVFPQLSNMDDNVAYWSKTPTVPVPNLKDFATELKMRIAGAYQTVPLYYELDDIRLFLGGLAMSQLHILQGMSGTGKTSIVKAFAKAVGGHCTDIAVQAGWRDKHDLIGHYNAFEKKYYEKECLQALYRAQVPYYEDRINVVLLDEMNLSRPEQYFAEFLSALEKNDANDRLIELREEELAGSPRLLVESRKIRVPKNIWFMGTANHDETTNDFADKTQDRSHVMELRKSSAFPIDSTEQGSVYSYASLVKRFRDAYELYRKDVDELLAKLESPKCEFTKTLKTLFGVSWGNRFGEHARKFIPAVVAAGGSFELALDHLLSARILRSGKVTGRYDITAADINEIERLLVDFWSGYKVDPVRCLELIEADRKRKERGA